MTPWTEDPASVRPMLASTGDAPADSPAFAYEPKYDGIRALASIDGGAVRVWSRLGNEKTTQFPEVAAALGAWGRRVGAPLLVDGEIVALDAAGAPRGFQNLQGRIHLKTPAQATAARRQGDVAFIAFDLLRDGDEDLRRLPLRERRARLARRMAGAAVPGLRLSEQVIGPDGRALRGRAEALGWEGLIAKRLDAPYTSGRRSPDWRKLKLVRHQTCVVGGWTAPRGSRPFFGALLLGVYDEAGRLQYIGHTGAGFSDAELGRVWTQLHARQTKTCPFSIVPRTNARPQWVKPQLVAEVKFTEWTADGKLRHPTYLGLRDDVAPEGVRKEPDAVAGGPEGPPLRSGSGQSGSGRSESGRAGSRTGRAESGSAPSGSGSGRSGSGSGRSQSGSARSGSRYSGSGRGTRAGWTQTAAATSAAGVAASPGGVEADLQVRLVAADRPPKTPLSKAAVGKLLDQLHELERDGGGGVLSLPGGDRLEVTNLGKPFWPRLKLTKGDLFRHYVRVAPYILPVLADRPLVMKRYPNGVGGKPFYQHRAPDTLPPGIRVEMVGSGTERRAHLIGGSLVTLLYTAQLGSISQDPWFSRAGSQAVVDHIAIDLDPPDDLPFARVLDVARWVREELDALKAPAFPKTSGSGGLHIYVPMPPDTPYDAGLLFAQIVATLVAKKHPRFATVERSVAARGRRIYVDYLQNIRSKTLASAYSARANDFAGVSTPLTWDEVDQGVTPQDFTIVNFEQRLKDAGDLWAGLRKSKGADLRAALRLGHAEEAEAAEIQSTQRSPGSRKTKTKTKR